MTEIMKKASVSPGDSASIAFSAWISGIKFKDGTHATPPRSGVTVIVGPNNVGKTALLREIAANVRARASGVVVDEVDLRVLGTIDSLRAFVTAGPHLVKSVTKNIECYPAVGHAVEFSSLFRISESDVLSEGKPGLGTLSAIVAPLIGAVDGYMATLPAEVDPRSQGLATSPFWRFNKRSNYARLVDDATRRVFGVGVYIARRQENPVVLRTGNHPSIDDDNKDEYEAIVGSAAGAHEQGDGFRSFVGTLLLMDKWESPIVLLDEPDAFLHPPQARELGALIARSSTSRQVFLTTHSAAMLRGVLSESEPVQVIHLRRSEDQATTLPHILSQADAAIVRGHPSSAYSRILEGLFHDLVVLCEGEPDCVFYEAVFDSLPSLPGWTRKPDVLFVPVSGKAAFPKQIELLERVGIPWRIIADFDALTDGQTATSLAKFNLEGEPRIRTLAASVHKAVLASGVGRIPKRKVREAIETVLGRPGADLDSASAREIREAVAVPSAFEAAKKGGYAALPAGKTRTEADELGALLRSGGVHVVPVGELESWDKTVGGKRGWVDEVLERHSTQGTWPPADLAAFVMEVIHAPRSFPEPGGGPAGEASRPPPRPAGSSRRANAALVAGLQGAPVVAPADPPDAPSPPAGPTGDLSAPTGRPERGRIPSAPSRGKDGDAAVGEPRRLGLGTAWARWLAPLTLCVAMLVLLLNGKACG